MSPVRVSLDDRLLAVLTEHGPLTTGRLRQLTGPHYQTTRVAHGRQTVTEPRRTGLATRHSWEASPTCRCIQSRQLPGARATPVVRNALRRLEKEGQVIRVKSPVPNNYGGDLWIRLDPAASEELTRGVEL